MQKNILKLKDFCISLLWIVLMVILMACSQENEILESENDEIVSVTDTPCVPNASEEVIKVLKYLKTNYGKKTISASMACPSWNVNEAEWIYQHTNKYPAIAFFDYISLEHSPCSWIDYSKTKVVEDWWNNNGLIGQVGTGEFHV